MHITKIETFQFEEHPREIIIQIHTNEGITGLGETNAKPSPVREMIHSICADILIGKDPRDIEHIWSIFYKSFNHHGASATEMRALSAIDIALWDILGKLANMPLYRMLGGKSREKIKAYNTCVGYQNNNDRDMFLEQPEKLAEELLEQGISAMKIWPFDELSREFNGQYISRDAVKKGAEPFRRIRKAFGHDMELIFEGHGRWNLPSAIRIARELEQYELLWMEDITAVNHIDTLSRLKEAVTVPIAASERLITRYPYQELLQKNAADIVITDPAWTGGISETKKLAAMAETFSLPFAPHNCGGPILHTVCTHLSFHLPNLFMMESVRAFYNGYYSDIVMNVPVVRDGFITPPEEPGLGLTLNPKVYDRKDLLYKSSEASSSFSETAVYNTKGEGDPWKRGSS